MLQSLEQCSPSLVMVDKLGHALIKEFEAEKTNALLIMQGQVKAVVVWVIRACQGQQEVTLVHPAAPLKAAPTSHIRVSMKLRESDATADLIKSYGTRSQLSRFLGAAYQVAAL